MRLTVSWLGIVFIKEIFNKMMNREVYSLYVSCKMFSSQDNVWNSKKCDGTYCNVPSHRVLWNCEYWLQDRRNLIAMIGNGSKVQWTCLHGSVHHFSTIDIPLPMWYWIALWVGPLMYLIGLKTITRWCSVLQFTLCLFVLGFVPIFAICVMNQPEFGNVPRSCLRHLNQRRLCLTRKVPIQFCPRICGGEVHRNGCTHASGWLLTSHIIRRIVGIYLDFYSISLFENYFDRSLAACLDEECVPWFSCLEFLFCLGWSIMLPLKPVGFP